MRVYLAAVQAEVRPTIYRDAARFAEAVDRWVAEALQNAPEGVPRLVAFPELFALPLLFWLDAPPEVRRAKTLLAAAAAWLRRLGRPALLGPWGFYRARALVVWPAYLGAFRDAARRHRTYLAAGTLFAPRLDEEPARGLYPTELAPRNLGLLLNPEGRVLARPEKVRLMPEERRALLRPGDPASQIARTRIGTVATLICLDAFHEALLERADAAGAWLVIQPSANPAPWSRPWPPDPGRTEGEAWLAEGLAKKIVGRENLRYGVNPMLTGRFFELGFEGRTNLVGPGGLIAAAPDPREEAVVGATVEAPGLA